MTNGYMGDQLDDMFRARQEERLIPPNVMLVWWRRNETKCSCYLYIILFAKGSLRIKQCATHNTRNIATSETSLSVNRHSTLSTMIKAGIARRRALKALAACGVQYTLPSIACLDYIAQSSMSERVSQSISQSL